jgi:hypothetical protein
MLGLSLGTFACDDGTPPKTAQKSDTKSEAKADTKAETKAGAKETPEAPADAEPANAEKPNPAPAPDGEDQGDLEGYDPRVAQAAKIANDITATPDKADELLAAANLDRDKLDALMYEIANDPALTAQYRMARGI